MRQVFTSAFALLLIGCPAPGDSDSDIEVDCNSGRTVPLQSVQVPDWPEGTREAVTTLTDLDGRWTAKACGTDILVSIRTASDPASSVELIDVPLQSGHSCGCTIDPDNPKDGDLHPLGYSTLDISVTDYPNPGFREEGSGNVAGLKAALFNSEQGLVLRACKTLFIPPILNLDQTDVDFVFRKTTSGVSGHVRIFGPDGVAEDSCDLTNWVRVGDN